MSKKISMFHAELRAWSVGVMMGVAICFIGRSVMSGSTTPQGINNPAMTSMVSKLFR